MSSSISALVGTRSGSDYAIPSLLPAPVIPLGPVEPLDAATYLPSSLLRANPFAWSSSSSTDAMELPALLAAHENTHSDLMLHLAVPSAAAQPLAYPVARTNNHTSMQEQRQQVVVGAEVMDAAYSSRLVISLKEDSERRRHRESIQRQAQTALAASLAQSDGDGIGASTRLANTWGAADGGTAFSPPSPLSADTAVSTSSSSTANVSSSMPDHSPQFQAVKNEMHSPPPAIGLLNEGDLRSISLPAVGKTLLASPDYRFSLDDGLEEFGDLSPPAMYTTPRRGSLCGGSCKTEQHEPLNALAYLHSLASTPCSSASSYQLTPTGTPSTPLATLPGMFSGGVMAQSLAAVRATEVPNEYKSSASFREIRALYAQRFDQPQQQQQLEHRRPSLYTVATSNTVAAAEVAVLQAVQQRTIAAKLKDSDINQQPSSDSEGEAAPIIVRQPVHQQASGSKKTTSKRKRKRKRAISTSKPSSGSSSERRRRSRDSDKENRPPQKCEQCHRRQADSGYGTGRFCGSKCARTYSINKRSHRHKQYSCSSALYRSAWLLLGVQFTDDLFLLLPADCDGMNRYSVKRKKTRASVAMEDEAEDEEQEAEVNEPSAAMESSQLQQ